MTQAHIGVIGVGTMGSALALNFAEKGQDVALWNLELSAVDRLIASAGDLAARLQRCETLADLVAALPAPRAIVLMIPAGAPVDQTIAALRPLLSAGDTIIDGGNSDFRDTMIRTTTLEKAGLSYLGIGVSGGALAGGFLRAHDPGANRRLNDAHRLPHTQRFNHGPTAGAFLPGLVHD